MARSPVLAFVFCVMALSVSAAQAADYPVAPVFSKLKNYRNYYILGASTPFTHHFDVWFINVDYNHVSVAANTVEEIRALDANQVTGEWGGIALPPQQALPPIPAEMQPLADAVRAKVMQLNPNAKDLKILYSGRFGTATVFEKIPTAPGSDLKRTSISGEVHFSYDEAMTSLKPYGFNMTGVSLLCGGWDSSCSDGESFVDFNASPAHLGKPMLLHWPHAGQELDDDQARFQGALFAAIRGRASGTYRNPIEALLVAQGEGELPAKFRQELALKIAVYGRVKDYSQQQLDREVKFDLPVSQAFGAGVTLSQMIPELKLTVTAEVALPSLKITLTPDQGDAKTMLLKLDDKSVIHGGAQVALGPMPTFKAVAKSDSSSGQAKASLPGVGQYTAIDAYFSGASTMGE